MRYNVNKYLVDTEFGWQSKIQNFIVDTEEDIIKYFENKKYSFLSEYDNKKVFFFDIPNAHVQTQLIVTEI